MHYAHIGYIFGISFFIRTFQPCKNFQAITGIRPLFGSDICYDIWCMIYGLHEMMGQYRYRICIISDYHVLPTHCFCMNQITWIHRFLSRVQTRFIFINTKIFCWVYLTRNTQYTTVSFNLLHIKLLNNLLSIFRIKTERGCGWCHFYGRRKFRTRIFHSADR